MQLATVDSAPSPETSPPLQAGRSQAIWRWLAIGFVVLVGIAGQVRVWASDRGLWADEIYIAINLRGKSWWELTGPLAYSQIAPPGWLFESKLFYHALGKDEQSLRFAGLLGAAFTLILTALLAWRAIGWGAAVLASALAAFSPGLLYYAGELKQYSTEAAAAMVLLLAMGLFVENDQRSADPRRRWLYAAALAATGLVVAPFSYSAIIVVAGATAGGVLVLLLSRRRGTALALGLAATPALAMGALLVWRRMQFTIPGNQYQIFPNGFPPEHAGPSDLVAWLPRMWSGFTDDPLGWHLPLVLLVLVIAGLVALVLRGKAIWAGLLGGLGLAALGAAALRAYPWEGRIAVYLLAPVLVAAAAGVDAAVRVAIHTVRALRSGDRRWRPVAALVAAALAIVMTGVAATPAFADGVDQVRQPRYRDPGRDILNEVAAQLRPGDVIIFYRFSRPFADWYGRGGRDLPIPGFFRLTSADTCQPGSVDTALAGARRLWFVRSARYSGDPVDYFVRVIAALDDRGRVVDSHLWTPEEPDSMGWTLIDLTAPPEPNQTTPPPDPGYACLDFIQ
ncbi:hypothetical protein RB614_06490 [Phytohabitans sp. ZYX-F-186]|uniref:Glycosyltransferase RgtA/B/C/D-like domain-containing protein n=1 Tax=Phytohabitans maris TaxID=3071409 RepID=A0ABU0ZAT2_9ACTN|nr:hypothetical protein [Phytohabitans sp. ZYX-F-186]MDQ7904170.1 hypothetical protein [Phytohabitans sp. ZYX-F-186]